VALQIHIVDDDPYVRRALERLLTLHGWTVRGYSNVADFESSGAAAQAGCLLLDMCLPDMSGLDLLARLEQMQSPLSVVLVSGYGDVPSTVEAMRHGALNFLTKPIDDTLLIATVSEALEQSTALWREYTAKAGINSRLARLTPRERQVSTLVASGLLNKQIAFELGTSEKTVKVHRGRVMAKLEVTSVAQLVRLLDRAEQR
jgi:FixJ family two-component response regulator